jgi:diadenosine tetraphosphate (Ap4A) HIT family hydrolase
MHSPCIFCQLDRTPLAESRQSVGFLDSFPVAKGHALIVPRRHVVTIWEMTPEEYADAFALVREIKDLLQKQFDPQGFNVGVNCGEAAGQSVWHAHIHIIPRYTGDVPSPRGGVRNIVAVKGNY